MAVARSLLVFVSCTAGLVLNVIGVPRTLPAAMLVLSLERNSERDGGQVVGMATPLAPMPVPDLMLKTGTREGSRVVWLLLLLFGRLVLAGGLVLVMGETVGGLLLLLFGWSMF